MKVYLKTILILIFSGTLSNLGFCQVQLPQTPSPSSFQILNPSQNVVGTNTGTPINFTTPANGLAVYEKDKKLVEQQEIQRNQIYSDLKADLINYSLPGYNHIESTKYYREAYNKLTELDETDFSIEKATFIIENAYFEDQQNYEEFNEVVNQTGDFLREKMNDLGYDKESNLAKNFMLFQFFSDTLEIKSKDLKHLPLKYDFDDYMGIKDWSKMFVSKLLETGKGQCNSLPRLYLILAEEIGAEAFLSLSPNHSYIKFRDEEDNWFNVELTNGMFTTDSSILQSGFIKSEALQNEIYMQTMTSQQLFSLLLVDFAQGYARKFGYDPFVKKVVDRALKLYPNNINAHMLSSNYLTMEFEYVAKQIGIDPRNKQELQNIRHFPKAISLLNQVNEQYDKIDNLGFEFMSPQAYQKWLESLQESKQKQDNQEMKEQFNIKLQPLNK
ncbi:hypothetical protein RM545_15765 [Zunongwangia sp. F260]|uniref:Protein SirB1 N-terminal domain-containing protein n=1 Tax=Autumnicola lenta TaxID=3075593 RepID=A0ABU3CP67_9FLAO|nr:hypothetical protein [Zunongwangia sp. F260]MDT0648152.1 hypothetical protein [Zunongwangia sp. F260]